jgi:Holliday junction DNA helicase RuvA
MISYLKGQLLNISKGKGTVMVGGVGYLVNLPINLPAEVGQDIELPIYTAVRENEISLWGFASSSDLDLFELLLTVSGVGLKTAYGLIQALGVQQIVTAIAQGSASSLKAPGVGGKTGERIVLELKGKLDNLKIAVPDNIAGVPVINNSRPEWVNDAVSALENLGYRAPDIEKVISTLDLTSYNDSGSLVKAVLVKI